MVNATRAAAVQMGFPLQPWQDHAADKLLRYSKGRPAYPDVLLTVPRQQGKTILVKAIIQAWANLHPNSNMVFIAQNLMDGRDRVIELGDSLLAADVDVRMRLAMNRTAIEWPNGSSVGGCTVRESDSRCVVGSGDRGRSVGVA